MINPFDQVSWLADRHVRPPSRACAQWHRGRPFPA